MGDLLTTESGATLGPTRAAPVNGLKFFDLNRHLQRRVRWTRAVATSSAERDVMLCD